MVGACPIDRLIDWLGGGNSFCSLLQSALPVGVNFSCSHVSDDKNCTPSVKPRVKDKIIYTSRLFEDAGKFVNCFSNCSIDWLIWLHVFFLFQCTQRTISDPRNAAVKVTVHHGRKNVARRSSLSRHRWITERLRSCNAANLFSRPPTPTVTLLRSISRPSPIFPLTTMTPTTLLRRLISIMTQDDSRGTVLTLTLVDPTKTECFLLPHASFLPLCLIAQRLNRCIIMYRCAMIQIVRRFRTSVRKWEHYWNILKCQSLHQSINQSINQLIGGCCSCKWLIRFIYFSSYYLLMLVFFFISQRGIAAQIRCRISWPPCGWAWLARWPPATTAITTTPADRLPPSRLSRPINLPRVVSSVQSAVVAGISVFRPLKPVPAGPWPHPIDCPVSGSHFLVAKTLVPLPRAG